MENDWWRLIGENQKILGYGWIDKVEGFSEISIYVVSSERGKGYAEEIINRLEEEIKEGEYSSNISCGVKKDNLFKEPMIKILTRNGYHNEAIPDLQLLNVLRVLEIVNLYKNL